MDECSSLHQYRCFMWFSHENVLVNVKAKLSHGLYDYTLQLHYGYYTGIKSTVYSVQKTPTFSFKDYCSASWTVYLWPNRYVPLCVCVCKAMFEVMLRSNGAFFILSAHKKMKLPVQSATSTYFGLLFPQGHATGTPEYNLWWKRLRFGGLVVFFLQKYNKNNSRSWRATVLENLAPTCLTTLPGSF